MRSLLAGLAVVALLGAAAPAQATPSIANDKAPSDLLRVRRRLATQSS